MCGFQSFADLSAGGLLKAEEIKQAVQTKVEEDIYIYNIYRHEDENNEDKKEGGSTFPTGGSRMLQSWRDFVESWCTVSRSQPLGLSVVRIGSIPPVEHFLHLPHLPFLFSPDQR